MELTDSLYVQFCVCMRPPHMHTHKYMCRVKLLPDIPWGPPFVKHVGIAPLGFVPLKSKLVVVIQGIQKLLETDT